MSVNLKDVHIAYGELCNKTYPVTGKTIVDSKDAPRMKSLIWLTVILVPLVVFPEICRQIIVETPSAEEVYPVLFMLDRFYFEPLMSFLWAMLGSCVFLVKKHADLAAKFQFDRHKSQNGWVPRVLIGTVIGGIAPFIFDLNYISETGIDENAASFLIGLSVKVFYGAIEKTVNEVAERFNLTSIKSPKSKVLSVEEEALEAIKNDKLSTAESQQLIELMKKMKNG